MVVSSTSKKFMENKKIVFDKLHLQVYNKDKLKKANHTNGGINYDKLNRKGN